MKYTLRFTRDFLGPLWPWYLAGAVAVLLTNLLSVRIPIELGHGLDALRAGNADGVGSAAWHIAALGLLVIVVRSLSRVAFFTPGREAEFNVREAMFQKLLILQPDFYRSNTTGDLMSRATVDVTQARVVAGFATLQVINVLGAIGLGVTQMWWLSPTLTFAALIPVALGFLGVQFGLGRMMTLQRQAQANLGAFADHFLGTIQGVATVQAFCVEGPFVERLAERAGQVRATNLELARMRAVLFPLFTLGSGVSVFVLIWVGGPIALSGALSPGQLAAFLGMLGLMVGPLMALGFVVSVIQRGEASLERIYSVLDAPERRPERESGTQPLPRPGRGPSIELRGLSFGYTPGQLVLLDLNVTVPAGATIGIFGRTGSGKSTLLRVLARLEDPPPGTVWIDGVDVRTLDLDAWRQRFVLVPQTPFLFGETIAENVGFGADKAEVERAVAAAALGPDLAAQPLGLQTVVGERGIVLSGGQRQRVALARGLLRPAELVMLDDVMSAVDHRTEQELIHTLRTASDSYASTRFMVSHRMSVLQQCDVVWVFEGGRLTAAGSHAELLNLPGLYHDAWVAQQGEA